MQNNFKTVLLIFCLTLAGCASGGIAPSHYAKYTFKGTVLSDSGHPIANARVKVRGWETATDDLGRWSMEQLVHCGALREHMTGFEEQDALLITNKGYVSKEEAFAIKHPAWFFGCEAKEQTIAFDSVLVTEKEKKESAEAPEKSQVDAPKESQKGISI